jgi:hypothetical protein
MADHDAHKPNERDDCAYLLRQAEDSIDKVSGSLKLAFSIGLALAFASVALNLGAVEVKNLKIADTEIVLTNFVFLRLFLTCASMASIVAILNFRAAGDQYDNLIQFLAEIKKYDIAITISEFTEWYKKTSDYKFNDWVDTLIAISMLFLLVALPLLTFIYSLFGH